MDAKLTIPVMGGAGEDFREKPRLDNVRQRWGQWVCQLSVFDSCKTLFRRHGIREVWGFRSYQMCGHRCCICSKWGCGRGGFVYRVNSTSSKLTNPMICFLQMGLGRETPLSTFAVDSGCRCSKWGFWLGWVNAGFLQSVCQLRTCAAGRCIGFDSCKTSKVPTLETS